MCVNGFKHEHIWNRLEYREEQKRGSGGRQKRGKTKEEETLYNKQCTRKRNSIISPSKTPYIYIYEYKNIFQLLIDF